MKDHPLRYACANELHARPFPSTEAPATAVYLAIKQSENASSRDRDLDRAHLLALLDRYGADHPAPEATHFYGQIGKYWLKWEQHTEFVTYTAFRAGVGRRAFDPREFDVFPEDWLADAPGERLTSSIIRIDKGKKDPQIVKAVQDWFVPESVAVSRVLDGSATIAGDFRIDPAGHLRFAVFVGADTGPRRVGRVVQRINEIETYKSMAMLGLAKGRSLTPRLNELASNLIDLIGTLSDGPLEDDAALERLLSMSSELEQMQAQAAFRFNATAAYEKIVNQRIDVLREERFGGRQTFAEFMMRRFDPAMRTVESTEGRLIAISKRANRASSLLRTKVDVRREEQNQKLLESMDKRADLQLRLQRTVEGLSVVAISYYAINLALYVLGPLPLALGLSKVIFAALISPIVILMVYLAVKRIRKHSE